MNISECKYAGHDFLHAHIGKILDFYEPICFDPKGGFFHCIRNDGSIYDTQTRHLVSSARFVFNYAMALENETEHRRCEHYAKWVRHGLNFIIERHKMPTGHYAWELNGENVSDGRAFAYGHAFVLLAAAKAYQAGIIDAKALIYEVFELMERLFWQEEHGTYSDERSADLSILSPYRGQNANMHMCEALQAAWQATKDEQFLDRSFQLADKFSGALRCKSRGMIWEHYNEDWSPDLTYNQGKPDDLFKPWGFQPGHQVEWAKLLIKLNEDRPTPVFVERAIKLYDKALSLGWDDTHGGIVYGLSLEGEFCSARKYFWVQSEAFSAAWVLFKATGDSRFLDDYERIWDWCLKHIVDHEHGAWFRVLERDCSQIDDLKSPPGKTDYHTMGACWDVLNFQK